MGWRLPMMISIPTEIQCAECGSDRYLSCPECGSLTSGSIDKGTLAALARTELGSLSDEHRQLIDDLLRNHEHETHRLARQDYLTNDGRDWRFYHERRVTELFLRERFALGPHDFGECCEPSGDFAADVATLGMINMGVDVAAAEGRKALDAEPKSATTKKKAKA